MSCLERDLIASSWIALFMVLLPARRGWFSRRFDSRDAHCSTLFHMLPPLFLSDDSCLPFHHDQPVDKAQDSRSWCSSDSQLLTFKQPTPFPNSLARASEVHSPIADLASFVPVTHLRSPLPTPHTCLSFISHRSRRFSSSFIPSTNTRSSRYSITLL